MFTQRRGKYAAGRADLGLTAASAPASVARAANDPPEPGSDIQGAVHGGLVGQPARRCSGSRTAGSTPQLPAVGAATMRFMQALQSAVFSVFGPHVGKVAVGVHAAPLPLTLAASPPAKPLIERSAPQSAVAGGLHDCPQTVHLGLWLARVRPLSVQIAQG